QVPVRCSARTRQPCRHVQHATPLLPVLSLDAVRAVAVLLPAARTEPPDRGLPRRVRRDMHARPGRRDHQPANPIQRPIRCQLPTIRADVTKAAARIALAAPPALLPRFALTA